MLNIVLVGETGVGKTGLWEVLCGRRHTRPTVTCSCGVQNLRGSNVRMWDTPGAKAFLFATKSALRSASIVLVVCDEYTYPRIQEWIDMALTCSRICPGIIVVMNKQTHNKNIECPYKILSTNSHTGLGMVNLHLYLLEMCQLMAPETVERKLNKRSRYSDCLSWLFGCGQA